MTRKTKGAHGFENRIYAAEEAEFLLATEKYQHEHNKRFLDRTDYFHVLTVVLGYKKPKCSKKTTLR